MVDLCDCDFVEKVSWGEAMKLVPLCQILLLFVGSLPLWADEVGDPWELTYEVFSLPLGEAAKLKRARLGDLETYAQLLKKVETGEVRQERWMSLKARIGLYCWSKEVEEFRYQTEYDYGEGLGSNPAAGVGGGFKIVPGYRGFVNTLPMTIDCKEIGDHFDCELEETKEGVLARLSIAHVGYLTNDSFGEGPWKMEMPRFSVQVIKVGVQLNPGTPALVGTLSLPRGLQKHDETKRVWLAFLTVEKDLE